MSLVTNYRIRCDQKSCFVSATPSEDADRAREYARRQGFSLGPREIRPGVLQHTDYCSGHKAQHTESKS